MNRSRNIVWLAVAVVAVLWTFWELQIQAKTPKFGGGIGPDVIVGDMPNLATYSGTSAFPGEVAFSVATTSCNIGDERLDWFSNTNRHPVISQNIYRIKDGRLEQLGQSWLKHGFFALSENLCGGCQPTGGNQLGIGCSDPYGAGLNGSQGGLGPKSEVNAATGFFPYPPRRLTSSQISSLGGSSNGFAGRIRIQDADLNPALNPGARYYIESQYVTPDDCAAGNNANSVSYREVFVDTNPGPFDLDTRFNTPTVRMQPVINAWKANNPDVQTMVVDIPGDGRVIVGMLTTESGNGFHTEIAIQNQTSDRCISSLDVDCGSGSISGPGFNDVDYQFEPYTDTDWPSSINGSDIGWATQTFAQNSNANAIRWGTVYSFWFDSDARPQELTLGVFKSPEDITLDVSGTVLADSVTVTRGKLVSGGLNELDASDDSDYQVRIAALDSQSRTEFEIKGVSPAASPSSFGVTLESSLDIGRDALSKPSNFEQVIELYNYDDDEWEVIDSRPPNIRRDGDPVSVDATGDLSRFVRSGDLCIEARIRYTSSSPKSIRSDADQFKWRIFP